MTIIREKQIIQKDKINKIKEKKNKSKNKSHNFNRKKTKKRGGRKKDTDRSK